MVHKVNLLHYVVLMKWPLKINASTSTVDNESQFAFRQC